MPSTHTSPPCRLSDPKLQDVHRSANSVRINMGGSKSYLHRTVDGCTGRRLSDRYRGYRHKEWSEIRAQIAARPGTTFCLASTQSPSSWCFTVVSLLYDLNPSYSDPWFSCFKSSYDFPLGSRAVVPNVDRSQPREYVKQREGWMLCDSKSSSSPIVFRRTAASIKVCPIRETLGPGST